jgi:hypothetical protein
MSLIFSLIQSADDAAITLVIPGRDPLVASKAHPNFESIVGACLASQQGESVDESEVADLFDIAATVERKFQRLGKRVSVEGDTVYFDGDPVESFLTDQILRFIDAGEDVTPLVNFWEKCENNPTDHSREQLYDWLRKHQFTITADGDIVGYKGVRKATDGGFESIHSGPARVNGEAVNGHVPNNPGDVIEMPRSEVRHDPGVSCSVGLHVATYSYASGFAQGAVLEVHVDPRDVVSVPTDSGGQKVRACRYTVVGEVEKPYDGPIIPSDGRGATVGLDLIFTDEAGDNLSAGDKVVDKEGDEGTVEKDGEGNLRVRYDTPGYGTVALDKGTNTFYTRIHGKGGPTSQRAKGRGKNPHQDNAGRYSHGRPGSKRDDKTGRFTASR